MCSFFVFGCSHIVKCLFPFTRKVGEFLVVGSLTVTWCNSLSSVAVVRCLDRSSLEEQGFILVCCSRRVQPVMVGRHGDRRGGVVVGGGSWLVTFYQFSRNRTEGRSRL